MKKNWSVLKMNQREENKSLKKEFMKQKESVQGSK
jgi:hypothetical protein